MNRNELEKALKVSIGNVLKRDSLVSFLEVLIDMGKLKKSDVEDWRFGRIPQVERVIQINLSSVNFLLRRYAAICKDMGLSPSVTVYHKWGKGRKHLLRFSKSGDRMLEQAYSTHYLDREKAKELKRLRLAAAEKKNASLEVKARKLVEEEDRTQYAVEHYLEMMHEQWAKKLSELNAIAWGSPPDQERPTSTLSNNPLKDDDLPF